MSDSNTHEEAHTGPIKTPQQLLLAVFFSFVVPVFVIIGLVYFVTTGDKPAAGAADPERSVAERIQKVGRVELRDANRPLRTGLEVYTAQCLACHAAGVANAPKLGDKAAWAPRLATGYEALVNSALKGKGVMSAQGGGEFNDTEIARAVVYMANESGGKLPEPPVPAGAAAPAAAPAVAPAAPAATSAAPAPVAAPVAASNTASAAAATASPAPTTAVASAAVPALYNQACVACHAAGVAGAPKLGDKAAWAPRLALGVDGLTASTIKGKGAMPARGGAAKASDAEIKAVVAYMVASVK